MKKIIFFVSFLLFMVAFANAQNNYAGLMTLTNNRTTDTIDNIDNTVATVTLNGAKKSLVFQINTTRISGTIAGTITVEGSADGVKYVTAPLSTVTLVNAATQNYAVPYLSNSYKKYRITVATTGTSSTAVQVYIIYRE